MKYTVVYIIHILVEFIAFRITVALNDCFVVSRTVMNTMMLSFMNKFLSCYVNGRKIDRMYH